MAPEGISTEREREGPSRIGAVPARTVRLPLIVRPPTHAGLHDPIAFRQPRDRIVRFPDRIVTAGTHAMRDDPASPPLPETPSMYRRRPLLILASSLCAGAAQAQSGPAVDVAVPADGDWPAYNRTLDSVRHSPLDEITGENVGELREICAYDTGLETSFQTGPLAIDGVLYFTTEFDTFAVDGANCTELWRTTLDYERAGPLRVNRGAAYLDGRLFRGLQDGRLVALDAATGELEWEVQIGITDKGETIPAAPTAWDGKVFVGNAGGDNYGVKGRMYAFDAATGEPVWETFLVPKEQNVGTLTLVDAPISNDATDGYASAGDPTTWNVEEGEPITGGASWTSYTLDPEANGGRGLVYIPTANPAPDFIASLREGANLMTNSITVLDAQDGSYVRHHLMVPEDFHDWDASAAPAVVTTADGTRTVLAGAKDGNLHAFEDVAATPTGGEASPEGLREGAPGGGEPASGVPSNKRYTRSVTTKLNVDAPLTPDGTYFCPGTTAGVMWNGPAYSPDTNLAYVGSVDRCTLVKIADPDNPPSLSLGQPWSGASEGGGRGARVRRVGRGRGQPGVAERDRCGQRRGGLGVAVADALDRGGDADGRRDRADGGPERGLARVRRGQRGGAHDDERGRADRRRDRDLRGRRGRCGAEPEDRGGLGHELADLAVEGGHGEDHRVRARRVTTCGLVAALGQGLEDTVGGRPPCVSSHLTYRRVPHSRHDRTSELSVDMT